MRVKRVCSVENIIISWNKVFVTKKIFFEDCLEIILDIIWYKNLIYEYLLAFYSLSFFSDNVELSRRVVNDRPNDPIAFQAILGGTKRSNLGRFENIKYDDVMFNEGSGYNNNTGTFTAPRNGVYIFSAAVLTANDNSSILYADLTKNGFAVARLHAVHNYGYASQTSVTLVTKLDQGDEIYVRISGSENVSIWGEKYSFFSGALVHNLDA